MWEKIVDRGQTIPVGVFADPEYHKMSGSECEVCEKSFCIMCFLARTHPCPNCGFVSYPEGHDPYSGLPSVSLLDSVMGPSFDKMLYKDDPEKLEKANRERKERIEEEKKHEEERNRRVAEYKSAYQQKQASRRYLMYVAVAVIAVIGGAILIFGL